MVMSFAAILSCASKHNDPVPVTPVGDTAVTIMGTTYPVVHIGNQNWTALNYNGPGGIFNTGNLDESLMEGKLYSTDEAAKITLPAGWHIPTSDDFIKLLIARGATQNSDSSYTANVTVAQSLMSVTGWSEGGGNNYSKFNALPTGFYHLGQMYGTGNGASFLMSVYSTTPPDLGFTIGPGPNEQPVIRVGVDLLSDDRCSIRFVKDN